MDSITYTTAGASQSVVNTVVNNMNFLQDAFYIEGESSSLNIQGLSIEQNTAIDTQWSGITTRKKAKSNITGTTISNNAFLRFGSLVVDSSVFISDTTISRNTGVVSFIVASFCLSIRKIFRQV